MKGFLPLYLLINLISIHDVISLVNINITKQAYNYVVPFRFNGVTYSNIVDTGSLQIENYAVPPFNQTLSFKPCYALSLDGTSLNYWGKPSVPCSTKLETIEIGTIVASNISIGFSNTYIAQNPVLHNWTRSNGDFGINYNYTGGDITPFQKILLNSTHENTKDANNQTFGIDFYNSESAIESIANGGQSTMQLGGILPKYADTILWYQQPSVIPVYHQFFIETLSFCGANLFSNYSNNWQVLVDTGSSCVTLPGEMYDTFNSWYTNQTIVQSAKDLPAISFQIVGNTQQTFYIPLGELLVQENAIQTEQGAPYVNIRGVPTDSKRICVLRGGDISDGDGNYNSPPPTLVFGALTWQALYFGADFSTQTIGIANKLSPSEILFYANTSNPSCSKPPVCIGLQNYDPPSNSCQDPLCSMYFFTILDASTKKCVYSTTALGFGLFFIVFILFVEFISFFVVQYTAAKIAESRTNSTFHIDRLTLLIGRIITPLVDGILACCNAIENFFFRTMMAQVTNNQNQDLQRQGQQPLQGGGAARRVPLV